MFRPFHGFAAACGFNTKVKAAVVFEKRMKKFSESSIIINDEYGSHVSLHFERICQEKPAERGRSQCADVRVDELRELDARELIIEVNLPQN
jgi:hypothetical protein